MDEEYEEYEEEDDRSFAEKKLAEKLSAHVYYSVEENKDLWDRFVSIHGKVPLTLDRCHPFGSRDLIGLNRYSISELTDITGGFSDEHFIQLTEDGKLFRGNIKQESGDTKAVTVKTFGYNRRVNFDFERNVIRFHDEIKLMTSTLFISNPRVVDVLGVCVEGTLSVVYDLKFHKSLYDVITLHDFGWDNRIKVASQLADVLAALHNEQYMLCVFNSSMVMVDESYDVKLFDLSHVRRVKSMGIKIPFNKKTRRMYCYAPECLKLEAKYSAATDVYAFGSVLLELFTKEVVYDVYDNTECLLAKRNESLVDGSLTEKSLVANEVESLVRRCLHKVPQSRPTMNDVRVAFEKIRNLVSSKKQLTG